MKRLAHYLLLAGVLVGIPLGCAWVGGYHEVLADVAEIAPQCEEWVSDPARLWRVKCPFNWWVFALFAAITLGMVAPFARRAVKAFASASRRGGRRYGFPWWGWVIGAGALGGGGFFGFKKLKKRRARSLEDEI